MSDLDTAFTSAALSDLDSALAAVADETEAALGGTRTLTEATDEGAIGGTAFHVKRFAFGTPGSGRSCRDALADLGRDLQNETLSTLPQSYPKDDPEVSVTPLKGASGIAPSFRIWEPKEDDAEVLDRFSAALAQQLGDASGLDLFIVESKSWAIQRSGVALVDASSGEGIWYSVRAVRALTGRGG